MTDIDRLEQARRLYERAVFGGDETALARAMRELDAVEADLALARGRILHARFLETRQEDPAELALFERAAAVYQDCGDARGEGEALFWIGCSTKSSVTISTPRCRLSGDRTSSQLRRATS